MRALTGRVVLPKCAILAIAFGLAGCVQDNAPAVEPGVIISAGPAYQPGENTGAAALAGMVILGAAGGQVGEGAGKAAAILGGLIIGAVAGSAAEAAAQPTNAAAYTIRLSDGRVLTFVQHLDNGQAMLPAGTSVNLKIDGAVEQILPQKS